MTNIVSGFRRVCLNVAAMGAAFFLVAGAPAFAAQPVTHAAPFVEIDAARAEARIVRVDRAQVASDYVRAFDRVSTDSQGWAPTGHRDVVRVVVEVQDKTASRVDGESGLQRITFVLDPATLSDAQLAALSQRRMSARIAAFDLNTVRVATTAREVDIARSSFCRGDEFRCEDSLAYRETLAERLRISVG